MTGQDAARELLDAITDFGDPTVGSDYVPSQGRPVRLATIDPAYAGAGNPKVTFDGESTMTVKTYPYLGNAPTASSRVAMLPVGRGYVIAAFAVGSGVPDASTSVKGKVELATDAEAEAGVDTSRAVTPSRLTAWYATKRLVRTRASATVASSASITTVTFGTSVVTNGSFSYSAGTFTCVTAGTYKITATLSWATNAAGVRSGRLAHSSGLTRDTQQAAAGFGHTIVLVMVAAFTVGQTIIVSGQQNSGSSLALTGDIDIELLA